MDSEINLREVATCRQLPARAANGHKGTFGKVLIVAGSRGMSGAACLAGCAALRGGAGLVTVAVPANVQPLVAGYEPSYLTLALADDPDGKLALGCAPLLIEQFPLQTVGAIGPGLGRSADLDELVHLLYRTVAQPLVIDADGLNALAHRKGSTLHLAAAGPRILTPHPGEFARLIGEEISVIQTNRLEFAAEFAHKNGVILVLKGPQTLITDGDRYTINSTGNSGLATGGTGDVLTGFLTACLSQGMPPYEAACFAVYLHGLAGDRLAEEISAPGLMASDLPLAIGKLLKSHTA